MPLTPSILKRPLAGALTPYPLQVGDPQELNSIAQVLCASRQDPLLIGSTKSNMGHPEPASGLAALTKVSGQLYRVATTHLSCLAKSRFASRSPCAMSARCPAELSCSWAQPERGSDRGPRDREAAGQTRGHLVHQWRFWCQGRPVSILGPPSTYTSLLPDWLTGLHGGWLQCPGGLNILGLGACFQTCNPSQVSTQLGSDRDPREPKGPAGRVCAQHPSAWC